MNIKISHPNRESFKRNKKVLGLNGTTFGQVSRISPSFGRKMNPKYLRFTQDHQHLFRTWKQCPHSIPKIRLARLCLPKTKSTKVRKRSSKTFKSNLPTLTAISNQIPFKWFRWLLNRIHSNSILCSRNHSPNKFSNPKNFKCYKLSFS